jgi:ornithine carbamoyltransferase
MSDMRPSLSRSRRFRARAARHADDGAAARRSAQGGDAAPLAGKMLAMIFEKPSTRTRVSFDVGMRQLGGETIMLTGTEMQLGRGETIADTARCCRAMSMRS